MRSALWRHAMTRAAAAPDLADVIADALGIDLETGTDLLQLPWPLDGQGICGQTTAPALTVCDRPAGHEERGQACVFVVVGVKG